MAIHPTAIVDATAKIDATAEIGPYAIIGPDAVIGARTKVGAHTVVEHATLGADNVLHAGCYVGTPPQDLKYAGEKTRLVMGDKNTVRECVTINRGTAQGGGVTKIGSNCLFMACSHVAHDCHVGNGVIIVNAVLLAGHVHIADGAVLGGSCAIHQYVRIGRFAMLGGGSMNGQDILPFTTTQGDRATLRGLNLLGMRRGGFSREAVAAVKDAYKTLFLSGLTQADALAQLKGSSPVKEVQEWIDFIESAGKRGVMRPAAGVTQIEEAAV
ncbi:MAG TPA: acyl-ACP--UDP-N-acetylglucosamine O-acyltransferase [Elusimicrobiota bacterium]|nr:acyl-ACP--UDP-N-acetylglucosamine O-acyltransferase [Elusimicrobiota bacterium]